MKTTLWCSVAVALLAAGAALRLFPELATVPMALAGRSPCPFGETVSGTRKFMKTQSAAAAIRSSARLLATDGAFQQWQTPLGSYWIESGSAAVLPILLGQQAESIYGNIAPGSVVLDCGAHVGVFAGTALRMGAAKVVAIEPAPDNVECLRRNFPSEIASGRVVVVAKGVWHEESVLNLKTVDGNSAGDSFVQDNGAGKSIPVPLTTIDRLVADLGLARVDLIKMDIKGAERNALRGAVQTLRRFHPRLALAAEHLPGDAAELPRLVRAAVPGYKVRCAECSGQGSAIVPLTLLFE